MICASILEKYIKFFEIQYSLDRKLFQMVRFQYLHNDTAEPSAAAISLLFATVESHSIYDYISRWVLRTGLEKERAER